jgi:hypothetical protein
MKCIFVAAVLAVLAGATPAGAASWIFKPSYYSHEPATPIQIGRQSAGGPVFTRPWGEYVRSGYRHVQSTIGPSGAGYDHTHVFESWIQVGSQY